ncbi:MAG: hypothetical protein GY754_46550 [bacterium]|nr:hypothetical protein [bacterium]
MIDAYSGFYNIMTAADFDMQSWMLGSLYNVVNNDVVKSEIFGKYINKLKDLRKKYSEEDSETLLDTVNEMLEMVIARSHGD